MEAFKLIPENERANALIYLDRDTINYLKLAISEGNDMDFIFKYLEEKIFNFYKVKSFRLFPKKQNNNYYYYQDQENNKEINESYNDFKLLYDELNRKNEKNKKNKKNKNKIFNQNLPQNSKQKKVVGKGEVKKEEDKDEVKKEEAHKEDEDFDIKKLPKQCRWCVFKYMKEKTKEAFNYIPYEDRFCCFRYLDKKTKNEFGDVPSEDRFRCFKYLDNRDFEAFNMAPEEDKFRCIIFLDKKENKEENK